MVRPDGPYRLTGGMDVCYRCTNISISGACNVESHINTDVQRLRSFSDQANPGRQSRDIRKRYSEGGRIKAKY